MLYTVWRHNQQQHKQSTVAYVTLHSTDRQLLSIYVIVTVTHSQNVFKLTNYIQTTWHKLLQQHFAHQFTCKQASSKV